MDTTKNEYVLQTTSSILLHKYWNISPMNILK